MSEPKYYIDENDVENWGTPLHGPNPDTVFYSSREDAGKEAQRQYELCNVSYDVFEYKPTKGILNLQMMGRMGNQAMQYLHGRAVAERDNLELRTPRWIGEKIFQIEPTAEPDYSGDYLSGYHQNQDAAFYTLTQVREWFRFRHWVEDALKSLKGAPLVAHRRVGDLSGYGYPVVSLQSYYNACHKFGLPVEDLCFVMEEAPTRMASLPGKLSFLPDFYIMCHAKTLLRANSSFSWVAGAINPNRVLSPVIDGLSGGEHLCEFVDGNHSRLCSLAGFTELRIKP